MKIMSIGYYTNGVLVSPKVPRKRFVSEASKEEKNIFRKRLRRKSPRYPKVSQLQ